MLLLERVDAPRNEDECRDSKDSADLSGHRRCVTSLPGVRCRFSRGKEPKVAIAYLQEFKIRDGDTSTTNNDAVAAAHDIQYAPDGLLIHTAGFDHDAGVFRILDVWETREQGEKFINDRLTPIIESMAEAAG